MRFTAIIALAASMAVAAALPADGSAKEDCSSQNHACNTYQKRPECSTRYNNELKACMASGCRKWFRDPTADCSADCSGRNIFHVCHTYVNRTECSPSWVKGSDACERTACMTINSAKNICKPTEQCRADDHPCNTYHGLEECSEEWQIAVQKCKFSSCIMWARDPLSTCN